VFAVNWPRPYNVFQRDSINAIQEATSFIIIAKETITSVTREGRNVFIIKALRRILTG
jgi:hypothetical protein